MEFIAILFLILLVIFAFVYVMYRTNSMLERHIPSGPEKPEDFGLKPQEHFFETKDGMKLFGWYFKVMNPKGIIILVHGFSDPEGGKTYMLDRAKFLTEHDFNVFLFDLRSFGQSEGNFISLGITEWMDVDAAYDYIEQTEEEDLDIGIWGNSMGAVSTLLMQSKTNKADFIIVTVPYASVSHLMGPLAKREKKPHWFIKFFVEFILKMKFGEKVFEEAPIKYVDKINSPVFIAKAKFDTKVHPVDSNLIYERIGSKKKLVEYDSTHNVWGEKGDLLRKDILEFIGEIL